MPSNTLSPRAAAKLAKSKVPDLQSSVAIQAQLSADELDIDGCVALIDREMALPPQHRRRNILMRLHSRFNQLRFAAERERLITLPEGDLEWSTNLYE